MKKYFAFSERRIIKDEELKSIDEVVLQKMLKLKRVVEVEQVDARTYKGIIEHNWVITNFSSKEPHPGDFLCYKYGVKSIVKLIEQDKIYAVKK